MKLKSIRARMTAVFVLCAALLMLAVCSAASWLTWRSADRAAWSQLASASGNLRDAMATDKPGSTSELLEEEREAQRDGIATTLVDMSGRVIQRSQRGGPAWPRTDDGWRTVTVTNRGRTLIVGLYWQRTARNLRRQDLVLATLAAFVVAASGLGSWLLVGRTLSPIGRLSRQAASASGSPADGDLQPHLTPPSEDAEVVELVATLNSLLAHMAETAAARGRIYAAASHELRTPLQALKGHLQLALSRDRSAAEYRSALAEATAQTERLTSLVRDLLLLNQLDGRAAAPVRAGARRTDTVDLADVCARAIAQQAQLIAERDLRVREDIPARLEVSALSTHAEMLVRNLVENAFKYATPGGSVDVALARQDGRAVLRVVNDSGPIEGWDAERVFEPFYRPDASRTAETGGNGLGLPIARALARANGGALTVDHADGQFRATAELPVAEGGSERPRRDDRHSERAPVGASGGAAK